MDEKYLSELIEYLEKIKLKHGDIAVYGSFREVIKDFSEKISIDELDEDDVYMEIG